MVTEQTLLLPANRKSHMAFRLAYLDLTLANSKGHLRRRNGVTLYSPLLLVTSRFRASFQTRRFIKHPSEQTCRDVHTARRVESEHTRFVVVPVGLYLGRHPVLEVRSVRRPGAERRKRAGSTS